MRNFPSALAASSDEIFERLVFVSLIAKMFGTPLSFDIFFYDYLVEHDFNHILCYR